MANEWHYTLNGQPAATPVGAAQLKQLAASGQLKPTDLVWQDGMLEWAPAGSVKGLFPTAKSTGDSVVVPPPQAPKTDLRKTGKPPVPFDWTNFHPAAVFVLTVLTAGLFGLFYVYKVCQAHAARGFARKADGAGRTLGPVRHPLGVLLLSYLTAGIYLPFWAARALNECGTFSGRREVNPRAELSLMLIFPPYVVYVLVVLLPEQVRRGQALAGVPETQGLRQTVLFLNPLFLLTLPFLAAVCQEALNQLWTAAP